MLGGEGGVTAERTINQNAELISNISIRDIRESSETDEIVGMALSKRVMGAWSNMRDSTRALIDERPFYGKTTIPASVYSSQKEDVTTFGGYATIVSHENVDPDLV